MTTLHGDELYFLLQVLDATVNAVAIDPGTTNLIMDLQEEALDLLEELHGADDAAGRDSRPLLEVEGR